MLHKLSVVKINRRGSRETGRIFPGMTGKVNSLFL